jgi:hypothetical protein
MINKLYRTSIFIISVCLFLSCCSTTQYIRYQNGTTVAYELPVGWNVKKINPPSDHFNIIEPDESIDSHPGITIDYYHEIGSQAPKTQGAYAQSYLSEIHTVKDDEVKMETVKTVSSPAYGNITIYNFYSDYYGDHLVAIIVNDRGYCIVELWRTISDKQNIYQSEFENVVRSIVIKHK